MRYLILFLALSACSSSTRYFVKVYTAAFITKDADIAFPNRIETTPFIWQGSLHVMVSARPTLGGGPAIEIYDANKTLISRTPTFMIFAAAYAEGADLYVFGTYQNEIYMIQTTDLMTWTTPVKVKSAVPGRELFNVSVTKNSLGQYIMAYETCEPNTSCFNVRFLQSSDLLNWTEVGTIFSPDAYAACPSIRFIDGTYYMLYLKDFGHYATVVARSTDLMAWKTSPIVALSALNTPGETINNSDTDIVEVNGETLLTYGIGDQRTYAHVKFAHYRGTMKAFFEEFF